MRRSRFSSYLVACLLALSFATSLLARGQAWAFLGYTQVDRRQDHSNVQVTRRDCFFRTIRLRVSEAIFFDRLVIHFGNGTSQELIISERILPEGGNYVIDLPGEPRLLVNVDLWYYKEPWGRDPKVSLYGIPAGSIVDRETAQEH
jgi:hypothetical protein